MWSRSLLIRRLVKQTTQIRSRSRATKQQLNFSKNTSKIFATTAANVICARTYARNLEPKDQKVFNALAKQEAVELERQAELAWLNRDWDRSTTLWRAASDSWERPVPKLTALHRLASLHCSRGQYELCEPVYREALTRIDDLARPVQPTGVSFEDETGPDYDVALVRELRTVLTHELGRVCAVLGRASEAQELFSEAAQDWRAWPLLHASKRGLTAAMSADVALFYEHRGNYREARQWHVYALTRGSGTDMLAWDHPHMSSLLHGAFSAHNKPTREQRNEVFESLEEVQHSLTEHRAHRGEEHITLVPLYLSEAHLARQLDLHARALQSLTRAAEITYHRRGERHASYGTVLHHLGLHHYTTENWDEAQQYSMRALQIKRAALGHDHFHVALIQWDLGVYKLRAHQHHDSYYLLDAAAQVLRKLELPRDHAVLQLIERTLQSVRNMLPRAPEATLLDRLKTAGPGADQQLGQFLQQQFRRAPHSAQGDAVQQLLNKYLRDQSK